MLSELQRICSVCNGLHKISKHPSELFSGCLKREIQDATGEDLWEISILYVYMCIYIYVCIHICVYVYLYIYVCIYICFLGLDEAEAGIKIAGRNVNNLRYADDTTLKAESKEELKNLLMKLKEERGKSWLKIHCSKN